MQRQVRQGTEKYITPPRLITHAIIPCEHDDQDQGKAIPHQEGKEKRTGVKEVEKKMSLKDRRKIRGTKEGETPKIHVDRSCDQVCRDANKNIAPPIKH